MTNPKAAAKIDKTGQIPAPGKEAPPRICPLPLMGLAMKEQSKVLLPDGSREENVTVFPCAGEQCMWHLNVAMPTQDGKVVTVGQCSVHSIAQALFGIGNASGALAMKFAGDPEAPPQEKAH